jgi:hypothetical protein
MQIELKRIQQEVGITFIYVTHDQEEALTMSDRIAVFNRGQSEQVGTPAEIYEHPTTSFVAGFVGVSNLVSGEAAQRLTGTAETFSIRPEKIFVRPDWVTPRHVCTDGVVRNHLLGLYPYGFSNWDVWWWSTEPGCHLNGRAGGAVRVPVVASSITGRSGLKYDASTGRLLSHTKDTGRQPS